jgi:hypothetical protein
MAFHKYYIIMRIQLTIHSYFAMVLDSSCFYGVDLRPGWATFCRSIIFLSLGLSFKLFLQFGILPSKVQDLFEDTLSWRV